MKFWRYWRLIILMLILSLQIHNPIALAKTVLSDMLLIPGEEPVRIKLPQTSHYFEIFTLRPLPTGTEIDLTSSAQFTILCPDLSVREISSVEPFVCPEKSFEQVDLMVEVRPPWRVVPPDSTKGDESSSVMLSAAELRQFHETEEQIIHSTVKEKVQIFLLVNLYASQQLYTQAIERFEDELTAQNDPVALRLLGYLYLHRQENLENPESPIITP